MKSTNGRHYVPHMGKGIIPRKANKSRRYPLGRRDNYARRHAPEGFAVRFLIARLHGSRVVTNSLGLGGPR
jgi:hypothetical protein